MVHTKYSVLKKKEKVHFWPLNYWVCPNLTPNYETGHNGHPNFQNQIKLYPETDFGGIELINLYPETGHVDALLPSP